jgi:molecular chaperone DnaK
LQVSAKDAASGISQTITVTRSANLAPEEVERLEKEAARYSEEDQVYKERVGIRIKAELLIAEAERTIEKYGKNLENEYLEKVRETVENLRVALKAEGETSTIQSLVGGLDVSLLELGRAIYTTARMPAYDQNNSESEPATNAHSDSDLVAEPNADSDVNSTPTYISEGKE